MRWFEQSFLLTFQGNVSSVDLFVIYVSCLSVDCSFVAICWEKAGLLALLYVMFSCVIVTFPCDVLCQVWYLIVTIPDFCFLLTYIYHKWASIKNCLFFRNSIHKAYILKSAYLLYLIHQHLYQN